MDKPNAQYETDKHWESEVTLIDPDGPYVEFWSLADAVPAGKTRRIRDVTFTNTNSDSDSGAFFSLYKNKLALQQSGNIDDYNGYIIDSDATYYYVLGGTSTVFKIVKATLITDSYYENQYFDNIEFVTVKSGVIYCVLFNTDEERIELWKFPEANLASSELVKAIPVSLLTNNVSSVACDGDFVYMTGSSYYDGEPLSVTTGRIVKVDITGVAAVTSLDLYPASVDQRAIDNIAVTSTKLLCAYQYVDPSPINSIATVDLTTFTFDNNRVAAPAVFNLKANPDDDIIMQDDEVSGTVYVTDLTNFLTVSNWNAISLQNFNIETTFGGADQDILCIYANNMDTLQWLEYSLDTLQLTRSFLMYVNNSRQIVRDDDDTLHVYSINEGSFLVYENLTRSESKCLTLFAPGKKTAVWASQDGLLLSETETLSIAQIEGSNNDVLSVKCSGLEV
jgi:hypothetical protein